MPDTGLALKHQGLEEPVAKQRRRSLQIEVDNQFGASEHGVTIMGLFDKLKSAWKRVSDLEDDSATAKDQAKE
ncbi:hypothetical protein MJD09_04670, partial [bacterium]|nr:hypothetical protein [bacterium]